MTWQPYNLDQQAQSLVLQYRDIEGVIGQSHKMRTTVAFGLERFWGEHLRLIAKNDSKEQNKGKYWRDTWKNFAVIMQPTGILLPKEEIQSRDTKKIQETAEKLWNLPLEDQRICLAVLAQFCDSLVWWTQRYKLPGGHNDAE
ncbi:hypothetical protein H6G81_02280 [Scytonema hofmannii FACHB-248]|uniref:CRISPR type III-B/RAMP module-associated protein Cmr5 n=1 Tax=Scytonema hofmannii FACHB-248 TaxID=1842502 RepID=A0ABR8GJN8_9CYAN|nr:MULTISPECIES: hypothetical protein [Nostocales]MBD2603385.1 hypothetical protein [Scytonema hofmannii FACHB-248]